MHIIVRARVRRVGETIWTEIWVIEGGYGLILPCVLGRLRQPPTLPGRHHRATHPIPIPIRCRRAALPLRRFDCLQIFGFSNWNWRALWQTNIINFVRIRIRLLSLPMASTPDSIHPPEHRHRKLNKTTTATGFWMGISYANAKTSASLLFLAICFINSSVWLWLR